jgi:5-methylcytosine-specific restriction endonuclease McrA
LDVKNERLAKVQVLHKLKEVENRKLHLKMGYSTLFKYAVSELKYSEGEAYRRIQAMRLIKDVPEVEGKILDGSITLTSASQLQNFFSAEKKDQKVVGLSEKMELIASCENKSTVEVQKELVSLRPELEQRESARFISDQRVELKINISEKLKNKLDDLKSLMSHHDADMSYEALIETLVEVAEPKLLNKKSIKKVPSDVIASPKAQRNVSPLRRNGAVNTRYIPRPIKRYIWSRDQGRCTYKSPINGKRCESQYLVQYDHVKPFALGGESVEGNLRLLCAQHNQLRAKETFRNYPNFQ